MTTFSPTDLVVIGLAFVIAGLVKGVAGMGLPTVAMGVLGSVLSPLSAASLLIVPSFITNVWQLFTGPSFVALIGRLWRMMLGIFIGTIAGAWVLARANIKWTSVALGATLVVYALWGLFGRRPSVPRRVEPWLSPVVGIMTGLVTGATGVYAIPAVPYLQALALEKDDLIQALGLSFTVSTLALAAGLLGAGVVHSAVLLPSLLATVPALLGMWLGTAIRARISADAFRRGFLVVLTLLGTELLVRPFF